MRPGAAGAPFTVARAGNNVLGGAGRSRVHWGGGRRVLEFCGACARYAGVPARSSLGACDDTRLPPLIGHTTSRPLPNKRPHILVLS